MKIRAFLMVAGLSLAASAQADVIFQLTQGNPALGGAGTYGTATVHQTSSTTATVAFASNTAGFFWFADGSAADVNVNATAFSLTSCVANSANASCTSSGSGNVDGWGSFNQTTTTGSGNPGDRASAIILSLTSSSGPAWLADGSNVLTNNTDGHSVAAHIFFCSSGINGTCNVTGFATGPGGNPSHDVPEPAVVMLLAAGLLGLWGVQRKSV